MTLVGHVWFALRPHPAGSLGAAQDATLAAGGAFLAAGLVMLGIRVRERLCAERAMRRAQARSDAAEAASRAKSEFLANMSHEIRTPMTSILGNASLLDAEERDPGALSPQRRREAIETIRRNGEHLLAILNDILELSKLDAGWASIEPSACSTVRVIEDVASLMRVRAEEKRLRFVVEHESPLPRCVMTDPVRMRQILVNLVGNAVKFTRRGGVTIRHWYAPEPSPRVCVDVIDTGEGVSREQASSIFEPFQQADGSTSRRFGGVGLGLPICKRLAQALGGEITLKSAPGEGSRFRLTLPVGVEVEQVELLHDVHESAAGRATRSHPDAQQGAGLHGVRILVAEDGRDNQRLISHLLRSAGAEVSLAGDGEQAVMYALDAEREGKPFCVVLMDMQMPVLDGYNATRRLRDARYTRPVLALTAHAMRGDRQRCIDAGCDDYLTKPIDREKLLAACARWASESPASRAA